MNADEGVIQFARRIHADPRQAVALVTSMLKIGLPGTGANIVDRLILEDVRHRTNLEMHDISKRVPTLFDRPDDFVRSGSFMAIHVFSDSSFQMSNQYRTGKSDGEEMAQIS